MESAFRGEVHDRVACETSHVACWRYTACTRATTVGAVSCMGYVGAAGAVVIVCWELIPESVSEGRWYTRYGVRVNMYTDTEMFHTLVHACV